MRIKAEVIPTGMSVTKAAELMGVASPALSNLLNGNATLSAEMAARLEKVFQYPLKGLMEMQARFETSQAKKKDAPSDTKAYVPPFLAIKANNIEMWASHNIPARTRLAVFLRTLVHSTGGGLTKVATFQATTTPSGNWVGRFRRCNRRSTLGTFWTIRLGIWHQRGSKNEG